MATILQEIMGSVGTMEYISSSVTEKNYDFLVVNEAATFTTLTSGGTDLVALYNLTAAPIAAGMVIRGAKGQNITAVAVSAGSVIGYTNI
jgi:hypothetical protein